MKYLVVEQLAIAHRREPVMVAVKLPAIRAGHGLEMESEVSIPGMYSDVAVPVVGGSEVVTPRGPGHGNAAKQDARAQDGRGHLHV